MLDSADGGSIDRIDIPDLSDFSHGKIDWRGRLEGAHWLVLSTSSILEGDNAKSAQGASMTFAEFEGPRTVMVTDIPQIQVDLLKHGDLLLKGFAKSTCYSSQRRLYRR